MKDASSGSGPSHSAGGNMRARIDWLLTPENAQIVRGHPALSNILLFARRDFAENGRRLGAVASVLRLIGEIRAARYELGAGLGLQLLDAEANASVPATPKFSDFSGAGPFATPAIDGTVLLDRHWSLNARAQYLHVTFESVGGLWEDYHGDLQYRWRRNLAAGLGFEYQEIGVNLNHSNPAGVVRLRIAGPEAFLRASF